MKYGKIPEEEQDVVLPQVDFTLPPDHADTAAGLAAGKGSEEAGSLDVRAGGTM